MIKVHVNPGICGLHSDILVDSDDMQTVTVELNSDCPFVKAMEPDLKELDGYSVCFAKLGDGEVYESAHNHCKHPGCPVPAAIVKGVEVACGLALVKDAEIQIVKE